MEPQPLIIVLAGPNGAGKSTAAPLLIPDYVPFLNADEVAKGLPGYPSKEADLQAGRQVLEAMSGFEERGESFAIETTLASRSLAPRIVRLRRSGYQFDLSFLWTPSPEFSINRVEGRVRLGGHSIPIETIRRRHAAGLRNLFQLYLPLDDGWSIYENTEMAGLRLIARGNCDASIKIADESTWELIREGSQS